MNESWIDPVKSEELAALRHEIHRWPEPGWAEFASTARAVERLEREGFKVRCGAEFVKPESVMGAIPREVEAALADAKRLGVSEALLARMGGLTGVVAEFDTGRAGPTVAIRCELDCVCVDETKDPAHRPNAGGWASERPGYMHACGHDGHIALGLGLAHELVRLRECLTHNVRLLFQPGEEGCRGARAMAAAGLLDGARHMVAAHIGMWADCDHSLVCGAQGFLATTKFDVTFTGRAAHAGAEPHKGANSLLAAASAALNMHALPRHGEGDSRITVGRLEAGSGRNTIPALARMVCETRGSTTAVNEYMFEHCRSIIEHTAAMYEQRCDIRIMGGSDGAGSDDALTHLVREIAGAVPWFRQELIRDSAPGFGSDDACVHMAAVQKQGGDAVYLMLGSDLAAGHHAPDFDFHEDMLLPSVELLTRLVIALDRR